MGIKLSYKKVLATHLMLCTESGREIALSTFAPRDVYDIFRASIYALDTKSAGIIVYSIKTAYLVIILLTPLINILQRVENPNVRLATHSAPVYEAVASLTQCQ